MAYDEELAGRIRAALAGRDNVTERKMFGGLCFMLGGNMACGLAGDRFMVRVGPAAWEAALKEPHTALMDFTGRPMIGMLWVDGDGVRSEAGLRYWVDRGASFAASLPDKATQPPKAKASAKTGQPAKPAPKKAAR